MSVGTVSNALNNPQVVSESTRERVRAAIERTGYIRNGAARALAANRSDSIGLVVPSLGNSFFVDIAKGALGAARERGLAVLVADADDDFALQDRHLDAFAEARAGGILLAPMHDSIDGISRVRQHGRRVVVVNYSYPTVSCCSVLVDDRAVGALGVEHLVDVGCDRVVLVSVDDFLQPVRERRRGVHDAVARLGLDLEEIEVASLDGDEGRRAAHAIADGLRATGEASRVGVLAVTDSLARGLLDGFVTDGRAAVPDRVAVMGLDGNSGDWNGPISQTTVELPGRHIGREAMLLLLEEIEDDEHEHRQVVLPPRLLARESTVGRGEG